MLGTVQMNNLNLLQGPLTEVERYFLFCGKGAGINTGKLIAVNSNTDFDAVLGLDDSPLKTQLVAAQLNAGQNWNAAVLPLKPDGAEGDAEEEEGVPSPDYTPHQAALFALGQQVFEAVVFTDPVQDASGVEDMQGTAERIMAEYMAPVFIMGTTRGVEDGETWEDYTAAMRPITHGIVADQVTIAPSLWGPDLGTYAGRLCDKSVTVADTPMRVKTGPLLGSWAKRPQDATGRPLDMAVLRSLDAARFSVPQWYTGYPGTYFGDGNVLDVPGGDFQVIENVRVIQKCMRRVYPLAVGRIGDRTLNETPASIAAAELYFSRPLREMSHGVTILGQPFPGEIHPPGKNAVTIQWLSKYKVQIWITARPYNCPKDITCNLILDLTDYLNLGSAS